MSELGSGRWTMTNVTDNSTNVIPLDDTREKLEADVREWTKNRVWGGSFYEAAIGWLDRQDAITQRDCIDRWDAKATLEIVELQAKVDELTVERDRARAEAKTQRNNFDVVTKARGAWQRIAEGLQRKADELQAALEAKEQLERDSAYMRLPVDADGILIRIGDEMEWTHPHSGEKERFVCAGYTAECITCISDHFALMAINDQGTEFYCDQCRHVQPDTVESLLEEFYGKTHAATTEEREELAAEYAERIRKAVER